VPLADTPGTQAVAEESLIMIEVGELVGGAVGQIKGQARHVHAIVTL
jgi:hypothetical protein